MEWTTGKPLDNSTNVAALLKRARQYNGALNDTRPV